jgi:hypothetical protein
LGGFFGDDRDDRYHLKLHSSLPHPDMIATSKQAEIGLSPSPLGLVCEDMKLAISLSYKIHKILGQEMNLNYLSRGVFSFFFFLLL